MAITKTANALFASANVPAYTSRSAPVTSAGLNVSAAYGGELTWRINNGSSGPTTPCNVLFQISHDNASWFDYYLSAGDILNSSVTSGSVQLDRGVMYVRVMAYGNETNPVTVDAYVQSVTGV